MEVEVVQNYVKTIAWAGKMKANIADFLNAPISNYNYAGGKKISTVIMRRNNKYGY